MAKKENKYQREVISRLEQLFPGCLILKNDPNYIQGIPDLSIFYHDRWAMLETKRSEKEKHQPNQDDYVQWAQEQSFGRFIFPENQEEVFHDLQQAFGAEG